MVRKTTTKKIFSTKKLKNIETTVKTGIKKAVPIVKTGIKKVVPIVKTGIKKAVPFLQGITRNLFNAVKKQTRKSKKSRKSKK